MLLKHQSLSTTVPFSTTLTWSTILYLHIHRLQMTRSSWSDKETLYKPLDKFLTPSYQLLVCIIIHGVWFYHLCYLDRKDHVIKEQPIKIELVFLSRSHHIRESKTVLDIWIPLRGFQIQGTEFQFLPEELGLWIPIVSGIPESLRCVPDCKAQYSWFYKQKFPWFWNLDSFSEVSETGQRGTQTWVAIWGPRKELLHSKTTFF